MPCSARVTVHFQAFMDKFSPHDAIFAISEAADLKDSALSAACSLHAASGSTSSSTSSLRRRRLGEITEDAEETRTNKSDAEKPLPPLPYELARRVERSESVSSRREPSRSVPEREGSTSAELRPDGSDRPDTGHSSSTATVPLILSHTIGRYPGHTKSSSSLSGRESTTASSPDGSTLLAPYSGFVYGTKTKVRLGPRPTVDPSRRAHTAGSTPRQDQGRPVSSLPAGIRMPQRRSQTANPLGRPSSQRSRFPISVPFSPPQIPEMPTLSSMPLARPSTSPHPASSDVRSPSSASSTHPPSRTPEKQKLMKALELRRRQLEEMSRQEAEASQEAEESPSTSPVDVEIQADAARNDQAEEPNVNAETQEDLGEGQERANTALEVESDPVEVSLEEEHDSSASDVMVAPEGRDQRSPSQEPSAEPSVAAPNGQEGEIEPRAEEAVDVSGGPAEVRLGSSPSASDNSAEPASTQASSLSDDTDQDTSNAATTRPTSFTEPVDNPTETEHPLSPAQDSPLHDDQLDDNAPLDDSASEANVHFDVQVPDTSKSRSLSPASDLDDPSRTPTPGKVEMVLIAAEVSAHADQTSNSPVDPAGLTPAGLSPRTARPNSVSSTDSALSDMESDSRPASLNKNSNGPRKKRRIVMEPIRTDISTENSDDNLLSDDSLMDELNSATVQEAKPVSVGKSPMAPGFPAPYDERRPSTASASYRAVSSPISNSRSFEALRSTTLGVPAGGGLNVTAEPFLLGAHDKQGPIAVIKKVNVSSGISQRIKALERVSSQNSRPSSPPQPASSTSGSPTFSTLRKASLRSVSESTQPRKIKDTNGSPTLESGVGAANQVDLGLGQQSRAHGGDGDDASQKWSSPSSVKSQIVRDIKDYQAHTAQASRTPESATGDDALANNTAAERRVTPLHLPREPNGATQHGDPVADESLLPQSRSSLPSPPSTRRPSIITIRPTSGRDGRQPKSSPPIIEPPSTNSSPLAKRCVNQREVVENTGDGQSGPELNRTPPASNEPRQPLRNGVSSEVTATEGLGITVQSGSDKKRVGMEVGDVNVQFPDNMVSIGRSYVELLYIDSADPFRLISCGSDGT